MGACSGKNRSLMVPREVSITEEDSAEALKNDYQEILRKYDPKVVMIQRVQAQAGEALHLKVTVKAPSHYLTTKEDSTPKAWASNPRTRMRWAPNRSPARPKPMRPNMPAKPSTE